MATAVVSGEVAAHRWQLKLPERLPELSGSVLIGYRAVWIVAAVLALLSATVLDYREEARDQKRAKATYSTGLITWGRYADGAYFAPFSPEAHTAGVQVGDELLRVDGKPAPNNDDELMPLMAGPDHSRVRLTLREPAGHVRDVMLTRSSHYLSDAYAGSGLTWSGRRWTEHGIRIASAMGGEVASAKA